jgi:uncharacterized protein (DUF305 family)
VSLVERSRDRRLRRAGARAPRVLAAGLLAATVAACGSGTGSGGGSDHADADVAFATNMIPHHAQGVEVAKLAATHASSSRIKQLATQISAEQVPEISQMQSLLAEWGEPPASTSMAGMASMPGMFTDQQMAQLNAATGPAFDRLFLQLMIVHDQGGVTMARAEMSDGVDSDATTLAQNIDDAQEYAIPVLKQLLTQA